MHTKRFLVPQELARETDYAIGLKQLTANSVLIQQYDVCAPTHFRP